MREARQGWAQVNGVSLRYVWHEGDGPTVVLLHEMGGCLESWDAVVAEIVPRLSVLRFDMRGAGLSEKQHQPFTLDDLVEDLRTLLVELGLVQPVALAGCAVGAAVALRFAARQPHQVRCVMAMSPATGIAPEKKVQTLQLAELLEHQGLRARLTQRFDHSYPVKYFKDPVVRQTVWGRLLSYDPVSYAETYRMLCDIELGPDLAAIACPTLVLAGREDTTRPPALVAQVASQIAGAKYRAVDSGHVMPVLTPYLVASALMTFVLAERSRQAPIENQKQ